MTAEEKRLAVRNKYREIIGRNSYSQDKRDYCFRKYSDGKYYSDCSSSVSYCYRECGLGFGILNTVGMYNQIGRKFTEVPVVIKNGQIQNPEILRIGDMLLYAGSDSSRKSSGYVGHVEMLGEISGSKYTLYGHGSGNPKKTDMVSKNKSRYNSKTSTALGHKGLIKVCRFIQDDDATATEPEDTVVINGVTVRDGTWNLRSAPDTGAEIIATVKGGTVLEPYAGEGWTCVRKGNLTGWISNKALED